MDDSRNSAGAPVCALSAVTSHDPGPSSADAASALRHPLSKRVLLVDDHPIMRGCTLAILRSRTDIRVVGEAANGLEAITLTRTLRPDVVVMDISMPVMDGIEATRRIRREMPEVRVIGFSSFEDSGIAESMRRAGAAAYAAKGSPPAELLDAILK